MRHRTPDCLAHIDTFQIREKRLPFAWLAGGIEVMSDANIYASGEYLTKNPEWGVGDSPWKAQQIQEIMLANSIQPATICEVGCGAGGIIKALSNEMPAVDFMGYDISPDAVKLANDERIVCTDFFEDNTTYDLILAIDVFEHVPDYMGFLERLAKRGRRFIFHIPLDMHVSALLRDRMIYARHQVGHLHYFSKATAVATLEDTGYRITDMRFTCACFDRPNRALTHLANIPRRMMPESWAAKLLGGFSLLVLCESA